MIRILLVDDDENFLAATAKLCELQGHRVARARSLREARQQLDSLRPDLLLLDLMLPDGNGLDLLDEIEAARPRRIALLTGHPGIKDLIRDLRGPAVSYLTKPLDTRELLGMVAQLDEPEADGDGDAADGPVAHFGRLVGESPAMQAVYAQISQVASAGTTVFIQGESGTGKELVAEAIHRESGRSGRFVPVNCGGLSRELVGTELFGHERGSFTGANRRHTGYFERAHNGTLFLDEITEMPAETQAHLLRALETGRVVRVGGEQEVQVDVRLLAATNQDPAEAVREGRLREDLYFRLQVFPIQLPPLRTRREDVSLLAEYFLDRYNAAHGTSYSLESGALEALRGYHWPGNVRELKHTVERACVMASGDGGDGTGLRLPRGFDIGLETQSIRGLAPGRAIRDVERDLIFLTLEHFDGDKKSAAETLGVSLKTLYNRLHEYAERDDDAPADRSRT